MTARPPQRLRRSAVQLTSMMDLLFVLLFAFMLKTSGDVELLAKEATAEVFEELDSVNQEVRQLLFVKEENISLAQQLSLAEQKIKDLEQSQRVSVARIAELDRTRTTSVTENFQAPLEGKWKLTRTGGGNSMTIAEKGFDHFIFLRALSKESGDASSEQPIRYEVREEMRGQLGTIYESLTGQYDPVTRVFEMKTQGFTHADGRYNVERFGDPLGLGYVLFLNPKAVAGGWGTFPSNKASLVTNNGRTMISGSSSHPDPERQLTSSPWTAVWLSP